MTSKRQSKVTSTDPRARQQEVKANAHWRALRHSIVEKNLMFEFDISWKIIKYVLFLVYLIYFAVLYEFVTKM